MKTIIKIIFLPFTILFYFIKIVLWLILLLPLAIINALADQ